MANFFQLIKTKVPLIKSKGAILVAGCSLLLFYFIFNPEDSRFMPQCIFHKITGLQCMGCGAQRMIHALLHADFKSAFMANAFLFCSLPLLIFFIWVEISRSRHPRLYARCHSLPVIISAATLLIAWFIVRNLLNL